jgi:hypothetical protein
MAFLKRALEEGVDPLALAAQVNAGSPQTETQHMTTEVLTGGGSAMDAAMSTGGGGSTSPESHSTETMTGSGSAGAEVSTSPGATQSRHLEAPVLTNQSEIPAGKTAGRGDDDWYDRNDDYRREGEEDDRKDAEDSDDPDTREREAEYRSQTGGPRPFR